MNRSLRLKVLGLCLMLGLATGCVGHTFDSSKVKSLELGSMKATDLRAVFGEPHADVTNSSNGVSFEEVTYLYATVNPANVRVRHLTLEFRDGVLNGYNFFSSFEEDKTSADSQKAMQIKKDVSTKTDVLSILGPPNGKAKSPTHMEGFEKYDKPGVGEIWCWASVGLVSTFGTHNIDTDVVGVIFNRQGTVMDTTSQKQSTSTQ